MDIKGLDMWVRFLGFMLGALLLAGCGGDGGGGGGTTASATFSAFTKTSDISAGDLIEYSDGRAFEGSYVYNLGTSKITSTTANIYNTHKAYATFGTGSTYASIYGSSKLVYDPSNSSFANVTWDCSTDTCGYLTADNRFLAMKTANNQDWILIGDRAGNNDYMVFGSWFTGVGTGTGNFSTYTLGAETASSAMPSTGTGTFTGTSTGFYIAPAGEQYYTISDVSASVNFGTGVISLSTTGSKKATDLINFTADTSLNFTSAGTVGSGTNTFSLGNPSATVGAGITTWALAHGEFFGPSAENMGGIWVGYSNVDMEQYTASFGLTQ
jgi:hypothetical protein